MANSKLRLYDYFTCEMSGDLFKLACKEGYDSHDFVSKLMNSTCGDLLYRSDSCQMWLGDTYVLSELNTEVSFKKGSVVREDVMYWIGYLFRYWSVAYPKDTAKDILKQSDWNSLLASYNGLHTLYWDEAIERIKESYKQKQ